MRLHLALVAILLGSPALAQQDAKQQSADPPSSAEQSSENMKGYGYGTQPGQESNAGAKQSTHTTKRSKAKKSKVPQDEQGAASTRAAEQEGSAAGAHSRAHTKRSHKSKSNAGGNATRPPPPATPGPTAPGDTQR